jgi:hypothetical protein
LFPFNWFKIHLRLFCIERLSEGVLGTVNHTDCPPKSAVTTQCFPCLIVFVAPPKLFTYSRTSFSVLI